MGVNPVYPNKVPYPPPPQAPTTFYLVPPGYYYSLLDILTMLFFGFMTRCIFSHIPQLLFNCAWAGANGGEIQICNEEYLKEQWEKDHGKNWKEKNSSVIVSSRT